jgi:hypothetical protein
MSPKRWYWAGAVNKRDMRAQEFRSVEDEWRKSVM